jgi:methionyl-tRNA synthetase
MKFYITTPIYYVNASPHIGHAYTTVAADVLKRHYEKKYPEKEVFFLTGTDEHGIKNLKAAKAAGVKPQEYVDKVSGEFITAWKKLGIDYDYFIRTTAPDHAKYVSDTLTKLKEKGFLIEDVYKGYYCEGCEAYKNKRDLLDGEIRPDHKKKCEFLSEKAWFFNLKSFEKKLIETIKTDQIKIEPITRKKEVLGFLKQGLINVAVSRKIKDWGIALPWDKDQTVYVWVDALFNYLSALKINQKEDLWPANLQIMSKDILRFHAIIWPALLMALELPLPEKLFVHGYLTIKGEKMSKSLGNIISVDDLIKRYGSDGARFMLLTECGFGADGEVSLKQFDARYNAQLANNLGNLVSRTIAMIKKYGVKVCHSGLDPVRRLRTSPSRQDSVGESQKLKNEILKQAMPTGRQVQDDKVFSINIDREIEELKFKEASEKVFDFLTEANQRIEKEKPWEIFKNIENTKNIENIKFKKSKEKLEELFYNPKNGIVPVILAAAVSLEPFMPEKSKEILKQLETLKTKILFEKII